MDKWTVLIGLIIIALIGGNVYQWQNPNVVQVPVGQEQIDSTSWVQQSTILSQRQIIDSLDAQNEAMASRIEEQQDQIANYTTITGRLKTQMDSLQSDPPVWNAIPLVEQFQQQDSTAIYDTTFTRSKIFGDGLFRVDGQVDFRYRNNTGFEIRQDFGLTQLRDIRIDVVSTINKDHSRALTYVTSSDFEDLNYKTYTELEPKKKWPWFLIGLGVGFVGAIGIGIVF